MKLDGSERPPGETKQLPFVFRRRGEPRFPEPKERVSLIDGTVARLERTACCICRTSEDEPLLVVKDWRYGLTREPFVIVRCRGCGLAYLNPRPVREDIGLFYPARYFERRRLPGQARSLGAGIGAPTSPVGDAPLAAGRPGDGEPAATRVSQAALAEEASLCGPSRTGRVLDVGCASGAFLSHMRSLGWDVQGLEVSSDAADWGIRELDLDIIDKPLPEAGLPSEQFDVVTFWSSLEHVHNPLAYLAETRRILKPGGRIVILIPNFASPTVRWLHRGLDPPRHLYHFTPASLRRILLEAGFGGNIRFRARTTIEDGSFDRQLAEIGRRLRKSFARDGESNVSNALGAAVGWSLTRLSRLLAPVSWALTAANRGGAMIATVEKRSGARSALETEAQLT